MKQIVLEKYHCMGNDYLVFDPNKNDLELNAENIQKMCSRHFGIGADGILAGPYLGENDFYVRIYNADGSEAEKSGNGMGIFAKYLRDAGYVQKTTISWKTLGGEETVFYLNEDATRVKISMGHPTFWSDEIPVTGERREMVNQTMVFGKIPYVTTCLSMGNPHCVIWMNEISKEMVCRIGEHSETSEYFPEKVNTQILNVLDRTNIQIEIYERGVGYTLASRKLRLRGGECGIPPGDLPIRICTSICRAARWKWKSRRTAWFTWSARSAMWDISSWEMN